MLHFSLVFPYQKLSNIELITSTMSSGFAWRVGLEPIDDSLHAPNCCSQRVNCGDGQICYQLFVAPGLHGPAGQAMVDLTATTLNDVLDNVCDAFKVPVVDAAETSDIFIYYKDGVAAGGPDSPINVRLVCQWTDMCKMQEYRELILLGDYDDTTLDVPRLNIHPNNEGHEVLADVHISLIKEVNLVAKAAPH
jgi:hypothetical protein